MMYSWHGFVGVNGVKGASSTTIPGGNYEGNYKITLINLSTLICCSVDIKEPGNPTRWLIKKITKMSEVN